MLESTLNFRAGPWHRALVAMLLVTGLASCNDYDRTRVPQTAGNTFDRINTLTNVNPLTERLVISYEYAMVDTIRLPVGGIVDGQYWQFAQQAPLAPDEFVGIHMAYYEPEALPKTDDGDGMAGGEIDPNAAADPTLDPAAVADPTLEGTAEPTADAAIDADGAADAFLDSGRIVKLGPRRFRTFNYCVGPGQPDAGPHIEAYVDVLLRLGYPISDFLYIQRYLMETDTSPDQGRVEIVYIADIVRDGYTCDALGDLRNPTPEQADLINALESRSQRAFEIMS